MSRGFPLLTRCAPTPQIAARRSSFETGEASCTPLTGPADGSPVFYCHGAIGTPVDATVDLQRITRQVGVRYIAPSRPGVGGSDPQPGRTVLDFADDVSALADALCARAILGGRCLRGRTLRARGRAPAPRPCAAGRPVQRALAVLSAAPHAGVAAADPSAAGRTRRRPWSRPWARRRCPARGRSPPRTDHACYRRARRTVGARAARPLRRARGGVPQFSRRDLRRRGRPDR